MSLLLAMGVTLAALAGDAAVTEAQHDPAADCVVLLHGMARSARSGAWRRYWRNQVTPW